MEKRERAISWFQRHIGSEGDLKSSIELTMLLIYSKEKFLSKVVSFRRL